jgi:hypothetical protein
MIISKFDDFFEILSLIIDVPETISMKFNNDTGEDNAIDVAF